MNGCACPPVNDCQPDPPGTLAKSHAFTEGAYRCDCGQSINVGDPLAIRIAAAALAERVLFHFPYIPLHVEGEPVTLAGAAKVLADLLGIAVEARS